MLDYKIYNSSYIEANIIDIINHIELAHKKFNRLFPNKDSTWTYDKYNIFSLAAPSSFFFHIYKELRTIIKDFCGEEHDMWIQSWVNYMTYNELDRLDWHAHGFEYHGYICLDPKDTMTDFTEYQIHNKIGQIYIGPGNRFHKVVSTKPYEGTRITIGFDVIITRTSKYVKNIELPWENMSFIPLL